MTEKVKENEPDRRRQRALDVGGSTTRSRRRTTKVSRKNQVTVPVAELRAAGLEPGDVVRVEALGTGRVILTRVDELVERYAGALDTGGQLARQARELRGEWRG
jgi:bifunctional DNA-binding transcriptional regulator/antitoxin component of YhaV-PrlF toxin-antitoxin module